MEEVTEFIAKHSWLMNFKVTNFFVDRVWENAPPEWLATMKAWSVEELTGIPFGKQQKHWPESLKDFISSCLENSMARETDLRLTESLFSSSTEREEKELDQHKKDEICGQSVGYSDSTFLSQDQNNKDNKSDQSLELLDSTLSYSVQNSLSCPGQEHVPLTSASRYSCCENERMIDLKGKPTEFSRHQHKPELSIVASERQTDAEMKLSDSTVHSHALLTKKSGDLFSVSESEIDSTIRKGMSAKKLHEVRNMSALINAVVRKSGADCVVDVGSGLGYLGQVLHSNFHHNVLGLEGKQSHTSGAERRTVQKSINLDPRLQNRTCELHENEESEAEFLQVLSDWLSALPPDGTQVCSYKSGTQSSFPDGMNVTQKNGTNCHIPHNDLTCNNTNQERSCEIKVGNSAQNSNFMKEDEEQVHKTVDKDETSGTHTACNNETIQTIRQDSSCIIRDPETSALTCSFRNPLSLVIENSITKTHSLPNNTGNNNSAPTNIVKNNSVPNSGIKTGLEQNKNTQLPSITSDICMVGLHCCGDLSPTMLKYFAKMDFIKSLCIVSCCYHRMEYNEDQFTFTNFPLSLHVKHCVSKAKLWYPAFHFTAFSMRLAAQETRARWREQTQEDHAFHTRNVAYRGILELCLSQGTDPFTLKKMSRRMVHKSDCESFKTYIKTVSKHINIPSSVSKECHMKLFQEKMWELYQKNEPYFDYIEPITALQFLLQPVLETLIYKDRQLWLEEQGLQAAIVPVFDEFISPRNLALIATKHE